MHKVSSIHGQNTLVKMVNMGKIVKMNIPFWSHQQLLVFKCCIPTTDSLTFSVNVEKILGKFQWSRDTRNAWL